MFADDPEFATWIDHQAKLVDAVDEKDLLRLLLEMVEALSPGGYVTGGGLGHARGIVPRPGEDPLGSLADEAFAIYVGGGYLLDPFYRRYRAGESGCLFLSEIKPDGFEEAEFCRRFYTAFDIVDELVHIVQIDGRGAVLISQSRLGSEGAFSGVEKMRHRVAHPLVAAHARRCANLLFSHKAEGSVEPRTIDVAVDQFGADLLTPREHEVIRLALYGHNAKSVAVQLGISADTVKVHRKRAYAKLRVSSQGELFFKFLEHLGLEVYE